MDHAKAHCKLTSQTSEDNSQTYISKFRPPGRAGGFARAFTIDGGTNETFPHTKSNKSERGGFTRRNGVAAPAR